MKLFPMAKHKKILFSIVALGVVAAAFFLYRSPQKETEEDVIWREYPVGYGDIIAALDSGGKLIAEEVPHSFDVSLKLGKVLVKAGQEVRTGDVLAEIFRKDLEKKMDEITGSLETARRALEDARNNKEKARLQKELDSKETGQDAGSSHDERKREINNTIQVMERKITLLQDSVKALEEELRNAEAANGDSGEAQGLKAELEELQKELARLEADNVAGDLTGGDAGVGEEIEQVKRHIEQVQSRLAMLSAKEEEIASLRKSLQQEQLTLESARFELDTQKIALNRLDSDYSKQTQQETENRTVRDKIDHLTQAGLNNTVKNAQAEVDKLQAELLEVKSLLELTVVTAKTDGVVTEVNYKEGDEVPRGKSVVSVGSSSKKHVITQVSQEEIGNISIGQEVEMQFLSNPDETWKGSVLEKSLVPVEGGDGVNYQVTVALDQDSPLLLQGMTCSVKFILKRVENVLTLNNKAITFRDGRQIVLVLLPDGSQEERVIRTGFSDGRVSEVTDGLAEGEIVVVAG